MFWIFIVNKVVLKLQLSNKCDRWSLIFLILILIFQTINVFVREKNVAKFTVHTRTSHYCMMNIIVLSGKLNILSYEYRSGIYFIPELCVSFKLILFFPMLSYTILFSNIVCFLVLKFKINFKERKYLSWK